MSACRLLWPLVLLVAAPTAALDPDRPVETTVGGLRGFLSPAIDGRLPRVMKFLGVPYASPPLGYLRFMPPKTPTKKSQVLDATRPPPGCPRPAGHVRAEPRRRPPPAPRQSEDCLYLNIYAPVTQGGPAALPLPNFRPEMRFMLTGLRN